jgi:hypothetical protein
VEVVNPVSNTFHYYYIFQISTDFELFKRFQVNVGLIEMCSYKLIQTPIANLGELHFGQGVHHDDLQGLHYHQADIHTQYLKIEEDIEILKVLSAKKKSDGLKAEYIGKLRSLPQFYLESNLDKECSIVFYNTCTTIWVTCTL